MGGGAGQLEAWARGHLGTNEERIWKRGHEKGTNTWIPGSGGRKGWGPGLLRLGADGLGAWTLTSGGRGWGPGPLGLGVEGTSAQGSRVTERSHRWGWWWCPSRKRCTWSRGVRSGREG